MTPTDDAAALNRQSIAVQVAGIVRDRIVSGELEPGTPLKEAALASNFGVSRNTIREALGLLAGDGIVTQNPFRGASVAVIDRDDIAEIFELRRFLEFHAIDATKDADEKFFRELEEPVATLRELPADADWRDIVHADLQFHQTLVTAMRNSRFDRIFENAITELRLVIFIANREDNESPATLAAQHGELLTLLREGDRRECKRRLDRHLADAERLLVEYLERHPQFQRD